MLLTFAMSWLSSQYLDGVSSYQEPEFLPWDGRRVPLTFVAGYLGAGKTTLINSLLAASDRPIAVIVNDVGEINIDARLIRKHSGDTIELTDGCVCCSSINGFGAAFDEIRAREIPPDHVVVELSGVAEPARMLPWGRSAGFKLDGVVTLVAADQFLELTERVDIGETVAAQVRAADLAVITKAERAGTATLTSLNAALEDISPGVPTVLVNDQITAPNATLTALLLRIGGRKSAGPVDIPEPTLFDQHRVERVCLAEPTTLEEIESLLDALDVDVMRAKGIAAGPNGERWAIQVVGRRREITELAEVESQPPTDLVVISL